MVDAGRLEALRGVRQLLVGGEALSAARTCAGSSRELAGRRLINGYGPTETTIFTCCYRVAGLDGRPPARCRSGGRSPTRGSTCWTRMGQPVPIGVPGELYAGGDGLARGYLEPAGADGGEVRAGPVQQRSRAARLYRTGDLGR